MDDTDENGSKTIVYIPKEGGSCQCGKGTLFYIPTGLGCSACGWYTAFKEGDYCWPDVLILPFYLPNGFEFSVRYRVDGETKYSYFKNHLCGHDLPFMPYSYAKDMADSLREDSSFKDVCIVKMSRYHVDGNFVALSVVGG